MTAADIGRTDPSADGQAHPAGAGEGERLDQSGGGRVVDDTRRACARRADDGVGTVQRATVGRWRILHRLRGVAYWLAPRRAPAAGTVTAASPTPRTKGYEGR